MQDREQQGQDQNDVEQCNCRLCDQPMKLIRRLPKIGAAADLLVFHCRECDEIDSASWRSGPAQNAIALN
jgi:hypothetical protein